MKTLSPFKYPCECFLTSQLFDQVEERMTLLKLEMAANSIELKLKYINYNLNTLSGCSDDQSGTRGWTSQRGRLCRRS